MDPGFESFKHLQKESQSYNPAPRDFKRVHTKLAASKSVQAAHCR